MLGSNARATAGFKGKRPSSQREKIIGNMFGHISRNTKGRSSNIETKDFSNRRNEGKGCKGKA